MNPHNTHSTDTLTQMIDRLISTLDRNIDRLVGDMQVTEAIGVIHMLQDMCEREAQHNKKTHTAE